MESSQRRLESGPWRSGKSCLQKLPTFTQEVFTAAQPNWESCRGCHARGPPRTAVRLDLRSSRGHWAYFLCGTSPTFPCLPTQSARPLLPSPARILVTLQVPPDKSLLLGGPPQSPTKHSAPASLSGLLMALLTCLSLVCLVSVNAGRSQGPHFTQGSQELMLANTQHPATGKTQPQKGPRACGRLAAEPRPGSLVI